MAKSLSEKQKAILDCEDNRIIIKACPGSGKTYSISAKLSKLLKENRLLRHQGIAVISFTNTACEQIINSLTEDFNISTISYPHFIGTIDSFINNFIFLPHGHLVMGCKSRPEIVGTEYNQWFDYDYSLTRRFKNQIVFRDPNYYFDKVSFDINGNLLRLYPYQSYHFGKNDWEQQKTKKGELKKVIKDLLEIKRKHFAEGKATQSDANYLSLKILREYPQVVQNIADRFPVFIIDEAQDTTTIQMAIIDLLNDAAISKIMMIGDPDQAIFEWNTADPSLFMEKYESPLWTKLELNENYRSSSSICNLINCFYSNNIISESPNKEFSESPQLFHYSNINDVQKIVTEFKRKCNELGCTNENVAIVYRGSSFAEQYLGITNDSSIYEESPWENKHYFVRDFVHGKFLIDKGCYKQGLKLLEKGYLKKQYSVQHISVEEIKKCIEKKGFRLYRQELFDIIENLPSTINTQLGEWIQNVNSNLNLNFIVKRNKSNILIDKLFTNTNKNNTEETSVYKTIHSVKGMSLEAILVFLKSASGTKNYKNILSSKYKEDDLFKQRKDMEEIRIIYVACSRPRKLLWIAVPESDISLWENKLFPKF